MVLLDVKFYIEVNDSFNPQHLKNLNYTVDDSSKHADDARSTKSYFCTKISPLSEMDRICNLQRVLQGIVGIIKIEYIECSTVEEKPKQIPKHRRPLAIILYETIGIAIGISIITHLALSGDHNVWYEVVGLISGFFIVEVAKFLKKVG